MIGRAIRVLHSFASLNRGGIETWLMNTLRQRPDGLHFDFLLDRPGGVYEEEAKSYGCRIYHRPPSSRSQKMPSFVGLGNRDHFLEQLLAANKYDVFHVHGSEFLGDAMKVAARMKIPVRIAHSHGTRWIREKLNWEWKLRYFRVRTLDRYRILKYATNIVACSNEAGQSLMGNYWGTNPNCSVLYCGIPLEDFKRASTQWKRNSFRQLYSISKDAIVVGHVGNMGPSLVKNHPFLIEVFYELAKRDDRYYLYMAGDGPLRTSIEQIVRKGGIENRVFMPGLCKDVPSLMIHGFDVHVLPSYFEGLPLVGLEAVASGSYTICSDTITKDFTDFFPQRVKTASLQASPSAWADKIEEAVDKKILAKEGIALVKKSPFSITSSLEALLSLYFK